MSKKENKKKKKMSLKAKCIISCILLTIAIATLIAACRFAGSIKPPERSVTPTFSEKSDVVENTEVEQAEDKNALPDKFTILAVGTDAASGSTDTIMLGTFDITERKLNIMSIPRDTIVNVRRKIKKINAAYANAGNDIYALFDEVESVTGIRPDHYVLVSLDGFIELVDAIGGVEVDVPVNMHYEDPTQKLKIHINKGLQTLNGYDAMGFMRFRATYAEGDIGRIKVQQIFVDALMKKMLRAETLTKIPELADIVSRNVTTDLELGNIIWIGTEVLNMDREKDMQMHTLPGYPQYYEGLSYYFPKEEEVLTMVNEFYNPYDSEIESLNLFGK